VPASGSEVIATFGVERSRHILRILELPDDVRVGVASVLFEIEGGLEVGELLSQVQADGTGTVRRRLVAELRAALT